MLTNRPSLPTASLLATLGLCAATLVPSHAVASQALAQKYACVACHQPATKTVGPSWKDIRAKYGDGSTTTTTATQLAATIKAGSTGKWGAMPMPPQPSIPDADLQTLAQWVLDGPRP
nr:c-type cytochrome [uncultured Albidiferax sp.]